MAEGRDFWLIEYQTVSGQYEKFLGLYIKTFAIYLAIMGGLLKFSLDQSATSELTCWLGLFGILCCLLLYACIIFAEIMTRKLQRRRAAALEGVGAHTEDELVSGHWAGIVFGIFNSLAIACWIVILSQRIPFQ